MRLQEMKRKSDKIDKKVREKVRELQKVLYQAKAEYEILTIEAMKGLENEKKRQKVVAR